MNPDPEIDDLEFLDGDDAAEESVDDFIRSLEEKEKDLHITANTTVIELADAFDDADEFPDFMKDELAAGNPKTQPAAAAPVVNAESELVKLKSEITALKQTVARLEDDRAEVLQASQRRAKDFENFKTRAERERIESFQTQVGNLATQMLPALDNLNRALDFALEMPESDRAEFQQFLDGVVLVNQQVSEVLAGMGIQPIATVGEPFDPHFHEAVATEESDEFPENFVSAELLKGYRIGDRVIRHSMVKVAKSEPPA